MVLGLDTNRIALRVPEFPVHLLNLAPPIHRFLEILDLEASNSH